MQIIFLVIFVLMISFIVLNILYKRTNHYKNLIWQVEKFKKVPEDIEIAAIGSGPGLYDISFETTEKKGFNFCMAPLSFEYAYKILKQYQGKLKSSIIIIITCPLSFAKNLSSTRKDYFDLYYYFLNRKEITNYSVIRKLTLLFPILRHPKRIIKIVKDSPPHDYLGEDYKLNEDEMEESVNHALKRWFEQSTLKDLQDESQAVYQEKDFEKRRGYLEKILQLCTQNAWKPVFVIPPMSEAISRHVSPQFQKKFVMDQLQLINKTKIPIIDYFRDEEYSKNDYYKECYFMNVTGKKKFSKKLFEDLKKIFEI